MIRKWDEGSTWRQAKGQVIGHQGRSETPRAEGKERTGRQTGFSDRFETEELGNRRSEDVKVKHADACAVVRGEGKGEVHLRERERGMSVAYGSDDLMQERYRAGEGANQRRCSFPLRLCRWPRRRPFSRSVCRVLAGERDAASLEVHLASEVPERRSERISALWVWTEGGVLRYERIVMAQSA